MAILPFLTHHQVIPAQSHYVTALTAIRNLWHVLVFGSRRRRHLLSHDKIEIRGIADSVGRLVFGRVDAVGVGLEHFVSAMRREAPFPVGVSDEPSGVAAVSVFGDSARRERSTALLVKDSPCYP